jgi:hypothetical protein
MSPGEYLVIGLAVSGAVLYLALRLRRKSRTGACSGGSCPVAAPKIRLAAPERRASTELR